MSLEFAKGSLLKRVGLAIAKERQNPKIDSTLRAPLIEEYEPAILRPVGPFLTRHFRLEQNLFISCAAGDFSVKVETTIAR